MIEPFEYEKTRVETSIPAGRVKNDSLDTSAHDKPLGKLNHFDKTPEDEHFLRDQRPFTKHFQEEFGRVDEKENNKADFQTEVWGAEGSMNDQYDVTQASARRENASVLISRYLDSAVTYVPEMKNTVKPIDMLGIKEPVLQPGISFVDSRKNMAVHF